ncbi:hypothetical protein CLIB1423_20S02234 [[Candida] railenensis]|uniref:AB hydrolase-1 domain-containing protein n=1 Tax=[Candida] railenensis TaxID=45579 RepID=A0A9P0QVC6_9ASCO|nr:hypothetical protein CLIB1423_20S02234 [[Candida] railenensis]
MNQFTVKLFNGKRTFTTLSSLSDGDILKREYTSVIFLLHGFPDDNTSYNGVWPTLAKDFPQSLILSPMMRGYEQSSQGKDSEYSISDLSKDIYAWINQVVPPEKRSTIPVHLVGHDWGAIAVFRASADYPDLIASASTLAIPYLANIPPYELIWKVPEQLYNSSYMVTMQLSILYKSALTNVAGSNSYLDNLWRYWSPTWNFSPKDIADLKNTITQPGVADSITGYYRCVFNPFNLRQLKWRVDFNKVPTLILGGEKDGCMSKKLYNIEMEKFKNTANVKVQLLSNLGHFLQREDPQKVGEVISDWIKNH